MRWRRSRAATAALARCGGAPVRGRQRSRAAEALERGDSSVAKRSEIDAVLAADDGFQRWRVGGLERAIFQMEPVIYPMVKQLEGDLVGLRRRILNEHKPQTAAKAAKERKRKRKKKKKKSVGYA